MIDDDDLAAWFTHPPGFRDHAHRIGNHRDDVKRHDIIETVIGKLEIQGVHLHHFDVNPAVVLDFLPRPREHVWRQVHAYDITMEGISWKGCARAGAHFENFCAWGNVEILDDPF